MPVRIAVRTFLLALAGLLALAFSAHAQQKVYFSIHADPQVTFFTLDNSRFENVGARVGVNAGMDFEYVFYGRYSLLTGASFDLRSANLKYKDSGYELKTKYEGAPSVPQGATLTTTAYQLQIPLAFKFRAIEIGYVTIVAVAGLTTNMTFAQEATVSALDLEGERLSGMWPFMNLGYLFRLGVEYSLGGASSIQMGLAFNGGITPSFKPGLGRALSHACLLRCGFLF